MLAGAGTLLAGGAVLGRPGRFLGTSGGTTFDGLYHEPLGDATLSTSSGSLVVSLGDGGGGGGTASNAGDDGVRTDTERALRWGGDLSSTIENMPVGGSITFEAFGTMDGSPGHAAGTATLTRDSSSYEYRVAYNSTTMSGDVAVEVFDGGESQLLHYVRDPDTYSISIEETGTSTVRSRSGPGTPRDGQSSPFQPLDQPGVTASGTPVRTPPDDYDDIDHFGEVAYSGEITDDDGITPTEVCWFALPLQESYEFAVEDVAATGDYVRVYETASGHDHEVYYTTEMRTTATGLDEVTFDSESATQGALFEGLGNHAREGATLTRTEEALAVEDGYVSLQTGEAARADVVLGPLSLAEDGQAFGVSATGVVEGSPGSGIGRASVGRDGEALSLEASFSVLETPSVEVTVFHEGSAVGNAEVERGTVAEIGGTPSIRGTIGAVGRSPAFWYGFDEPAPVTLASGERVEGTWIRLGAADSAASVSALDQFNFGAEGVGEFLVTGENVEPL